MPERLNSIEVQQVMSDVYESTYGIFNHVGNAKNPPSSRRPLATVAFHKSEDFTAGSLLEDTMKAYRDLPIYDIFKISYLDFMKQTSDIVNMMIEKAKERRAAESKAAQSAENNLQQAQREHRQQQAKALTKHTIKSLTR